MRHLLEVYWKFYLERSINRPLTRNDVELFERYGYELVRAEAELERLSMADKDCICEILMRVALNKYDLELRLRHLGGVYVYPAVSETFDAEIKDIWMRRECAKNMMDKCFEQFATMTSHDFYKLMEQWLLGS